jgi:DNA-directed RNA polymerase subunit RPC12/RpoP
MRIGPVLQYFCSSCGKVLREASTSELQIGMVKEECPGCGSLLVDTLQNRRLSPSLQQPRHEIDTLQKPVEDLSSDFQIAYRQVKSNAIRLGFDIEKLDLFLNLTSHGSLCIIGEQMYTQLLLDRLCVHSMLPRRHGGISEGYSKIIAIDAGNYSDVYQIVNFARQYGLDVRRVLQNILVSRVFTIYQLAQLIGHELPTIIKQISSERKNYVIVVYDILHLFVSDPHIDKMDAKLLLREISSSIKKLSEESFVIVSSNQRSSEYKKYLLPVCDNKIGIKNDAEDRGILQVDICHITKKATRSEQTRLSEHDILLVPTR